MDQGIRGILRPDEAGGAANARDLAALDFRLGDILLAHETSFRPDARVNSQRHIGPLTGDALHRRLRARDRLRDRSEGLREGKHTHGKASAGKLPGAVGMAAADWAPIKALRLMRAILKAWAKARTLPVTMTSELFTVAAAVGKSSCIKNARSVICSTTGFVPVSGF